MSRIKVGIVGTGYTIGIANNHVRGYLRFPEECELIALYDIVPGRAASWANENSLDVHIASSYEELLDSVDAVSICTPNYAHVELATAALKKGRHVLCEKPLSIDSNSCLPAVNVASCTNVISMIGFSYRGIPAVKLMKDIIHEGRLGKIFTWRETLGGCRIANPDTMLEWRMQENLSGTGALADFGCHMIDLCDWILSKHAGKIKIVQGFISTLIEERDKIFAPGRGKVTNDDVSSFNLKFESGTIASFVASRLGVHTHTIEVYGEGGMILFRDDDPLKLEVWFKDKNKGYTGSPEILSVPEDAVIEPWFDDEIKEFLMCIKTGNQPERNFNRALYIQSIIDAIFEAAVSNKNVDLN